MAFQSWFGFSWQQPVNVKILIPIIFYKALSSYSAIMVLDKTQRKANGQANI